MTYLKTILAAGCAVVAMAATPAAANDAARGVVASIDSGTTCEAAKTFVVDATGATDQVSLDIALMRHRQCLAEAYNAENPDNPQVVLASFDPQNEKVLFRTISVKNAEDLYVGCRIATSVVTAFSDDPVTGTLGGALGSYGCDAYFEAAIASDPLLILMPTHVPGLKLTRDVWAEVRRASKRVGTDVPGTDIPLYLVAPGLVLALEAGSSMGDVQAAGEDAVRNG